MPRTITMRRRPGTDSEYTAAPSVRELDEIANWLDTRFSILGIRFGFDSIMGLVPGIGDFASLGISSYLIMQGYRLGARKRTLARMGLNVLGDTIFGSIPVVGTVIDVAWKANRANMRLLRKDLQRPGAVRRM